MKTTRKVALNTLVQVAGKVVTAVSTLVITIIITRRFGTSGYGDYTIMITYPAFFWIIADFGFNAVATREIVKNREETQRYFENLLLIRFLFSLVLIIIAFSILYFLNFPPTVKLGATVALITLITMSTFSSCNSVFQTNLRYDFSVMASSLGAACNLALVFVIAKSGGDLLQIVYAAVLGNLVTFLAVLVFVGKFISWRIPKVDTAIWRYLILTTFPVGVALVFNRIYFKIDSFLLYTLPLSPHLGLSNAEATGIYGAAYKIFEVILELPTYFMNAVYPVLVVHFTISSQKVWATFQKAFNTLVIVALPVAVGTFILAKPLMVFVGGGDFTLAATPLRILMIALVSFYISSLFMWMVMVLEKQKILALIYGIGAVVNVSLNLMFIPKFGLIAAAAITGITEIVVLVLSAAVVFSSMRSFIDLSMFYKSLMSAFLMGIPVYALKDLFLPIPVFVGASVYFVSLFFLYRSQIGLDNE